METFSASQTLCEGNPPVTGEFPSQRPVMLCFDVFFVFPPEQTVEQTIETPGDFRRHRAHYDVTAMMQLCLFSWGWCAPCINVYGHTWGSNFIYFIGKLLTPGWPFQTSSTFLEPLNFKVAQVNPKNMLRTCSMTTIRNKHKPCV